jgi:hypothetical protein
MDRIFAEQLNEQQGQQRVLRTVVIAAAIAFLFTTVTMVGPCHVQIPAPPAAKPLIARKPILRPVATVHAVVQAAVQAASSAPRKAPRVRAAVEQALLRLPTTPLLFLTLLILIAIAAVVLYRRASSGRGGSLRLPHVECRAFLQVFLI